MPGDLTDDELTAICRASEHPDTCRGIPLRSMRAAIAADRERRGEPFAWIRTGDGYATVTVVQAAPPEPLTWDEAVIAGWRPLYTAPPAAQPVELSDERIDHIADLVVRGMPDGLRGFCRLWGWQQFARALLADCAGHVASPPAAQAEPDMRHPKIQALIGSTARRNIELSLVEQVIDNPDCDLTAMDMEYWGPMHDKLREALTKAQSVPAVQTEPTVKDSLTVPAAEPAGSVAWQPIETAPVSGRGERPRWFLAFNGRHIGVCARWGDEGYGEHIADESDQIVTPSPTHWMPLPAAPTAPAQTKEQP